MVQVSLYRSFMGLYQGSASEGACRRNLKRITVAGKISEASKDRTVSSQHTFKKRFPKISTRRMRRRIQWLPQEAFVKIAHVLLELDDRHERRLQFFVCNAFPVDVAEEFVGFDFVPVGFPGAEALGWGFAEEARKKVLGVGGEVVWEGKLLFEDLFHGFLFVGADKRRRPGD